MSEQAADVLVLVLLLQVKHLFADFFLQTPAMLTRREVYWHLGRAAHAGVHVAGSLIALALVGTPLALLAAILLAEFVVHFHIDWAKARFTVDRQLTPADAKYWHANGVDQALHQATYLAMTWAWVVFTT